MKDYTPNSALDWTDETDITTITPAIIDRSRFLYVQEMGIMHAYPTFFTKRENLPSYLLLCTDSGNACLQYRGREYHLCAGDFFFIDCMEYQHYYTESKENWICRFVHIYGPEIIRHYYDIFVRNTGYVMHLPALSKVPLYIMQIIESYKPRRKNSDLIAAMHIIQLLTEAVLNSDGTVSNERAGYVQDVARYIDEHYEQDITLENLSKKFNISRSYLPKQFKSQIGVTPTEYLSQVRVQAAKELLRRSDTPIYDVAQSVGIDNVSYFIKLFKKYEQTTPYIYRKTWNKLRLDAGTKKFE